MAHTPAVAGDTVHVGSCNGVIRQLDRKTGKVSWTARAHQGAGKYFFHGDLLITPDLVIAGADADTAAGGGNVHAFDRSTGRERWKRPAGRGVAAALTGLGRRVFASTLGGQLWALDLESGDEQWSFPLQMWGWEGPVVSENRVIAGGKDGTLYAIDADSGRVAWQTKIGAPITTSVRRNATALYFGTVDGLVHRVDPRDGKALSSRSVDPKLKPSGAPVVTADGVFVLLADDGGDVRTLVSLDLPLNAVRWRVVAPDRWTTTRVFVWGKTVVLGTPSGTVTAHCTADGSPAWSETLKGTIRSIGGADDALYVGTVEGTLYALRPPSACGTR